MICKPAPGSTKAQTRVGRGIAAGKGKTAGRGTKGQKARAGGSIPAWFEGGQTPLHSRIPKLRGFKNPFKIEYEVVNVGDIAPPVELGELEPGDMPGAKPTKGKAAPITVNQEILRAAGLVRRLDRPMKVLGDGELSTALFVVADAFSASAAAKIEAAGGTVQSSRCPIEPIRRSASRPERTAGRSHSRPRGQATAEPRRGPPSHRGRAAGAEAASQGGAPPPKATTPRPPQSPSRPSRPQPRPPTPTTRRPMQPPQPQRAAERPSPSRVAAVFESLLNAFRAPDIRRRILFVLGILVVYRLLAHVPVPGVDRDALAEFFQNNPAFGILDLFSGGGLSQLLDRRRWAMNPYINASIIMQLMTGVVPRCRTSAARASTAARRSTSTPAT